MDIPQTAAPILSTPDTHIFEDPTPTVDPSSVPKLSHEQLHITYEIQRTIREIRDNRWRKIALQFPDEMLVDAPRVYEGLRRGLRRTREAAATEANQDTSLQERISSLSVEYTQLRHDDEDTVPKVFILADTSYGSCCVDEVAAEHVDADVVVHYGRACLSPTSRLPVVYVFTTRPLELERVVETFRDTYPERDGQIIIMADIPYSNHIPAFAKILAAEGYWNIFATDVVHDPSSAIPNRTVPPDVAADLSNLREYSIFHISDPPTSLLLTLSSRASTIHIYPAVTTPMSPKVVLASSTAALRRRYALLTSLSTCAIFGILINTLSVKNYLHIVDHVKGLIAAAGKKSYTFVVGKVNAAKVANFSEVGGWVVIGCWESSLIESKDFFRPLITPFELDLALKSDAERVWTGAWTSDFEAVLKERPRGGDRHLPDGQANGEGAETANQDYEDDSESEDEPPEFDLRTGRYISHTRPMRVARNPTSESKDAGTSQALARRANGDLIQIGGVASPGAAFLREQRTWKGLGSDLEIKYQEDGKAGNVDTDVAARVEEGRSGIARGYMHSSTSGEVKR